MQWEGLSIDRVMECVGVEGLRLAMLISSRFARVRMG